MCTDLVEKNIKISVHQKNLNFFWVDSLGLNQFDNFMKPGSQLHLIIAEARKSHSLCFMYHLH